MSKRLWKKVYLYAEILKQINPDKIRRDARRMVSGLVFFCPLLYPYPGLCTYISRQH